MLNYIVHILIDFTYRMPNFVLIIRILTLSCLPFLNSDLQQELLTFLHLQIKTIMHIGSRVLYTKWGNGLVVSTPTVVEGLIPAFSTCLFHVVPRVLGGAADETTGPIVLYGRIKLVLSNCVHLFGGWARVQLLVSFNAL